jgi:hypothetical protein
MLVTKYKKGWDGALQIFQNGKMGRKGGNSEERKLEK